MDPIDRQIPTKLFTEVADSVFAQKLPGATELAAATPEISAWIDKQREKIDRAIEDEDEVLLDKSMRAWVKAW